MFEYVSVSTYLTHSKTFSGDKYYLSLIQYNNFFILINLISDILSQVLINFDPEYIY